MGGLFYAVFYPAVFIEHSTLLEAPAATATLVALLLLTRAPMGGPIAPRVALVAGALLGVSAGIKIWGLVALLPCSCGHGSPTARAMVSCCWRALALARPLPTLFAAVPGSMWRMVILDQLGRPRSTVGLGRRLTDMVGLSPLHVGALFLTAVLVVAAVVCVLALRSRQGRLAVVVLLANGALLLCTPPWFTHYAGLTAAPAAITVGAAASTLIGAARSITARALIASILVAGLAVAAVPVLSNKFGRPFPAAPIAKRAASLGGCVTTDDPTTLIQTNLLQRNLQRGCKLVVDLGGYSYDIHPGTAVPRSRNRPWQRFAMDHLRSGSGSS